MLINLERSAEYNSDMTKICKRCKRDLPLDAYGIHRQMRDGLFPTCKDCERHKRSCPPGTKVCSWCFEVKSRDQYRETGNSKRLTRYCSSCEPLAAEDQVQKKIISDREWYERNHDEYRERQIWVRLGKRYGLTREQYEEKLEAQGHVCAICHEPSRNGKRLHVDHDHATGQVRDLLCYTCNIRLGVLEGEWYASGMAYLEKWHNDD